MTIFKNHISLKPLTAGSNTKINCYAFGMALQGRKYSSSSSYRYGFNGKENDKETVGTGEGTQDYGFRLYNPSLGKFLSVDPLFQSYPWFTPYQFAGNTPIWAIDLDGLENKQKNWVYDVTEVLDQKGNIIKTEVNDPTSNSKYDGGPVQVRYFQTTQTKDKYGNDNYSSRERVGEGNVSPASIRQFPTTSNPNDKSNLAQQNSNSGLSRTTSGSVIKKSESPVTAANQNNPTVTITLFSISPNKLTDKQVEDRIKSYETDKQKQIEKNKGKNVIFQDVFVVDPNQKANSEKFGILTEEGEVKRTPEELEQKIIKDYNAPGDK